MSFCSGLKAFINWCFQAAFFVTVLMLIGVATLAIPFAITILIASVQTVVGIIVLAAANPSKNYGTPLLAFQFGVAGGATLFPGLILIVVCFPTFLSRMITSILIGPALGAGSGGIGFAIFKSYWANRVKDIVRTDVAAASALGGTLVAPAWVLLWAAFERYQDERGKGTTPAMRRSDRIAKLEMRSEAAPDLSLWHRLRMTLRRSKEVRYESPSPLEWIRV